MEEEPLVSVDDPVVESVVEDVLEEAPQVVLAADDGLPLLALLASAGLLLGILATIVYVLYKRRQSNNSKSNVNLLSATNSVAVDDLVYLVHHLTPTSTPLDVLYTVLSTPEMQQASLMEYQKVQELRQKRRDELAKTASNIVDFDVQNMGGWDDDDDDDTNTAAHQHAEQEQQAELERLKLATGQATQKMEGLDEGVLGQAWVERTLTAAGAWPPVGALEGQTFLYQNKPVTALDHPGLRRYLCMTTGRLNSHLLNGHPELLEAGANKLIDQTYFKSSMELRGKVGTLLEAALRVATMMRSFSLMKTVVQSCALFKIGCQQGKVEWFQQMMMKQYECLPQLKISNLEVTVKDENEIATGDVAGITMDVERTHAEKFLQHRLELFKKQGIPPEIGLKANPEGWWMLVRHERLDGATEAPVFNQDNPILQKLPAKDVAKFNQEDPKHRMLAAWPMIVQNIQQKSGKIRVQFQAPNTPGKYKFIVGVESQDFLGTYQEVSIVADVKDATKVKRTPKPESAEAKKDQ